MSNHHPSQPGSKAHEENLSADAAADSPETRALLDHPSYKELMRKLDETEQKVNDYWERILRMQADAENARRRHEKEIANAHKYALEKFVDELLPIIDSLEMCIANEAKETGDTHSAVEGVRLTLNMFYNAMEKFGVKQVNPLNEPFNPEYQQAIAMEESDHIGPGTVLRVLQKGYTLNDRLIRPAFVVVSKAK
jgi:molecular chaperone GrpE